MEKDILLIKKVVQQNQFEIRGFKILSRSSGIYAIWWFRAKIET